MSASTDFENKLLEAFTKEGNTWSDVAEGISDGTEVYIAAVITNTVDSLTPTSVGLKVLRHSTSTGLVVSNLIEGRIVVTSTGGVLISIPPNTAFNTNFETDVNNIRMNGVVSVGSLDTVAKADHVHPTDTSLVKRTEMGTSSGVATLDGAGKVLASQIPSLAISETFVVASRNAMLALSAQIGDVAIRTDISRTYILQGANPGVFENWVEVLAPLSPVTSVFGRTGTVTTSSGDYNADQISDGVDYHLITTAQQTILNNTSNTNTGDQPYNDDVENIKKNGVAAPGVLDSVARADHVHPGSSDGVGFDAIFMMMGA